MRQLQHLLQVEINTKNAKRQELVCKTKKAADTGLWKNNQTFPFPLFQLNNKFQVSIRKIKGVSHTYCRTKVHVEPR